MRKDMHQANRQSWNEATRAHNSHKADQARFLREGGSTLFPEELELLGDLRGKTLLHLDEAAAHGAQFERVFSSYGAVIWLSNLAAWARGIAHVLAPGGCFVLVEFHPILAMLDDRGERVVADYGGGEARSYEEGIGDYVAWAGPVLAPSGYLEGAKDFRNPLPGHEWNWSLAEVVSALLDAGLRLETLREYPYANGFPAFEGTVQLEGGRFSPAPGRPRVPLMYAVSARKPDR
jgi:SAM-dependent methyltransferase